MPTPEQRFYLARHRRLENSRQLRRVRPHPDRGENEVGNIETEISPVTKMWRKCPRCIRIVFTMLWLIIAKTEYIFAFAAIITTAMALIFTPFMVFHLSELLMKDSIGIGNLKYMPVVIFCFMGLISIKMLVYVFFESIKGIIEMTDWKNI